MSGIASRYGKLGLDWGKCQYLWCGSHSQSSMIFIHSFVHSANTGEWKDQCLKKKLLNRRCYSGSWQRVVRVCLESYH